MSDDGVNKKKITRWLRPLIFPFEDTEPKAFYISIKHVSVSGKLADVRTMRVPEPRNEATFPTLVTDIEQAAIDDAEGTGGVQKYIVQALDNEKHAISRATLRYAATRTESEIDGELDSEGTSLAGQLAQQMRHNEAIERIDKAGWGNIINTQRLQIESLTEQNAVLVQKHLDMLDTVEELTQHKHEREMDMLKEQNKVEVMTKVGNTFTALLPAVVKKYTGADIKVTDPETLSMRQLLQTLTEDQITAIQGVLSQDQMISLLAMLQGEAQKTNDN